jgi:putative nucleotidyltransferase with HDIG domain
LREKESSNDLIQHHDRGRIADTEKKNSAVKTVKPYTETLFFEAAAIRDFYTRGHCRRVRTLARRIALCIDLADDFTDALEIGALLHDIGKIGIPESLLIKTGRLNESETKSIERHTVIGENILKAFELFRPCLNIIRHHHERFDGRGYPDGLSGANIVLSARIVALSDAFDAMTSSRPYREALPLEAALSELIKGRASQFDPLLVDVFIDNRLYLPFTS